MGRRRGVVILFKRFKPQGIKTIGNAASIGLSMVLAIVIGFALGWWVDNTWPALTPWGKFAGLGIGIVAAYRNLYVLIKRIQREMDENERDKKL